MATNTTNQKKKAVSRQNNTGRPPQGAQSPRSTRPGAPPQRTQGTPQTRRTGAGPQRNDPRRGAPQRGTAPRQTAPRGAGAPVRQRNAAPPPKRRKKTPEEIAAERKRAEAEAKRRKERRREAFRKAVTIFLARLIVTGLFFAVIVTAGVVGTALDLLTGNAKRNRPWSEIVVQTLNVDEKNPASQSVEVPGNWAYVDGVCYMNFSRIAAMYDMTLTGEANEIRYLLEDAEGQSVRFAPGSGWFAVNDIPCRFAARIYQRGEDIYVPVSFAEYYLDGITVYEDVANRSVVITRICDTDPQTFIPLSFRLHGDDPDPHIVEKLLDADILAMTDPYAFSEIPDNYME